MESEMELYDVFTEIGEYNEATGTLKLENEEDVAFLSETIQESCGVLDGTTSSVTVRDPVSGNDYRISPSPANARDDGIYFSIEEKNPEYDMSDTPISDDPLPSDRREITGNQEEINFTSFVGRGTDYSLSFLNEELDEEDRKYDAEILN